MFSRDQLKRAATLTKEDFVQLGKCRRPHNRLGFAYQVAFVRLFDRFPQQQPFELIEELLSFSAAQLGLDAGLIELYRKRQPTISEHQQTINGIDLCLLEHVSPIEWDNVVLYGQYILDRKLVRQRRRAKKGHPKRIKLHESLYYPSSARTGTHPFSRIPRRIEEVGRKLYLSETRSIG
jgi:hypothetical protein